MITIREHQVSQGSGKRVFPLKLLIIGAFLSFPILALKATENECSVGEKLFEKRGQLIGALHKMGAQPTPQEACSKLTPLAQNGGALLTWMRKEKEWCKISDDLLERLVTDHQQATKLQKQACDAAKAPVQPKMTTLGDSSSSARPRDDKSQLTSPIPVPQEIPPLK